MDDFDEALDLLSDALNQGCHHDGDVLDSLYSNTWSDVMEFLERQGRFRIEDRTGRGLRGRFISEGE